MERSNLEKWKKEVKKESLKSKDLGPPEFLLGKRYGGSFFGASALLKTLEFCDN